MPAISSARVAPSNSSRWGSYSPILGGKVQACNAAEVLNFQLHCSKKHPKQNQPFQGRNDQMKLVRYGNKGAEKPGLIDKSGQLRDLSGHIKDLDGEAYSPASLKKLAAIDPASLPTVSGKPRLGAPVTGMSKFVAIDRKSTRLNSSH